MQRPRLVLGWIVVALLVGLTAQPAQAEQADGEDPPPGNQAPWASFYSYTPDFQNPRLVNFDASSSGDSDGSIVSYDWNFGDGNTGWGPAPSTVYANPGSYDVTLTVTDDGGLASSTTATVTVWRAAPQASIVAQIDPNDPLRVTLDASGSTADGGSITAYDWDYGDGQTGNGAFVDHTYAGSGTYTVRLTVFDDSGISSEAYTELTVVKGDPPNQPPTANMSIAGIPVAPANLSFDAVGSSDYDGFIVSYAWDFGDGSTASGPSAEHTYTQSGTYSARLTVTDDDGATNTTETPVSVTDPEPPATTCNGLDATIVGTGDAVIRGTKRDDVIVGTVAAEKIYGGGGEDVICSGGGDDQVWGEKGRDVVFGGDGVDVIDGGAGTDQLNGDDGNDRLLGGEARDVLIGGEGSDELRGGDKGDTLYGEAGDDALYGEEGNDVLFGGAGQDLLNGGAGRNVLHQN